MTAQPPDDTGETDDAGDGWETIGELVVRPFGRGDVTIEDAPPGDDAA